MGRRAVNQRPYRAVGTGTANYASLIREVVDLATRCDCGHLAYLHREKVDPPQGGGPWRGLRQSIGECLAQDCRCKGCK